MRRILFATSVLFVLSGLEVGVATADPWRPVRSIGSTDGVRLAITTGSVSEARKDLRWERVALGDTLVFECAREQEMQVQTRPILKASADRASFRLGVEFDGRTRRFLRHTSFDGFFYLSEAQSGEILADGVLLGGLDRLTVDLESSSSVRVYLRGDEVEEALVRVVLRGADRDDRVVARAGEWSFDVALGGAGYDDNAYLAPKETPDPVGATFWPADVRGEYRNKQALPFDFRARYEFDGKFYDDPILESRHHSFELRERWEFGRWAKARKVDLTLSQELQAKDSTFFGRGDFEEFQTGGTTSLSNRFDYISGELNTDLTVEWTKEWSLEFDTHLERRNYDADYTADSSIYSLDQNRWEIGLGLAWEARRDLELSLRGGIEGVNYDEKFSRDQSGAEVISEPTQYRSWPVRLELRRRNRTGLQGRVGLGWMAKQDLYDSYWNSSAWNYAVGLGWKYPAGHSLEAAYRGSSKSYEYAHVGYDPTNPLREKDRALFSLEGYYSLRVGLGLLFDWRYEDRGNNSPQFAYERSQFFGGIVYRY